MQVAPAHEGIELGVGDAILIKVLVSPQRAECMQHPPRPCHSELWNQSVKLHDFPCRVVLPCLGKNVPGHAAMR